MQCIFSYVPEEANHVCGVYNVAAILWSQLMAHVMLFPFIIIFCFYISTFWSLCAVPNMAVLCSSLISCFPGMLLRYFLNYLEMVPVASITIGVTSVFTVHVLLFFSIFSLSTLLIPCIDVVCYAMCNLFCFNVFVLQPCAHPLHAFFKGEYLLW
jgi:hypothetical protein